MNRKDFIKTLAILPMAATVMKLNALYKSSNSLENTETMPVLFLGHGSPMNAIEENEFVQGFRTVGNTIQRPKAILCISAHWETKGTYVTAMEMPKTIHDFGGFPQELFEVQYPAPGSPELAMETKNMVSSRQLELDHSWGLDHGAWSVIKHLYPSADVPVIQMSLDYNMSPSSHYELAKELALLRKKGILIIGSGNMVHNLGVLDWNRNQTDDYAFDWAKEAKESLKSSIVNKDHQSLINYKQGGIAINKAIPTPEHFLPLIYSLALQSSKDDISIFNDKSVLGSIAMTSVMISSKS
jgi:4,5-DOPA dioxygenase extradiol